MFVYSVCAHACTPAIQEGQKMVLGPLELESLQLELPCGPCRRDASALFHSPLPAVVLENIKHQIPKR